MILRQTPPPEHTTQSDHSPLLPEDQEVQASQPGQGCPAEKKNRGRINCHLLLRLKLLIIITSGNPYLDSRNTRCAIFSINTRQTLKKQADESVESFGTLTERRHNCAAHKQKCVHSHSLPFCQPRPVGPGYLGCPAEDNQSSISEFAARIKITALIQVVRKCFIFFCLALTVNFKGNILRVTYFVSLVSCISGWSLRSLLTLQTTERLRVALVDSWYLF